MVLHFYKDSNLKSAFLKGISNVFIAVIGNGKMKYVGEACNGTKGKEN